jgi:ABC-type uncharacterized transport system, permease component
MTAHDHHHEHGENCHCHDCEEEKNNAEKTSMEEAGGVAVGLKGHIHGYNADAEARLAKALLKTGKWVEKESGSLLGHIKAAVYKDDGTGVTLNLTDVESGVEHHGVLEPCEKINFSFMAAVLDVDSHELEHMMMDLLEESGLNYHLDNPHHHHDHDHCDDDHHDHSHGKGHDHHHHGHDHCGCEDHDHQHGHHHDHDHCGCEDHDHKEHDHHHKDEDNVCHCKACEERRHEAEAEPKKNSFLSKIRRRK